MSKRRAVKPETRTLRGIYGECESCGQTLPLHPNLGLCGCCAFGEADALDAFAGEWTEERVKGDAP
jgi:hypothetical protein